MLITNIQRFSLHDGPGIRTTVFLKGCSIHCPWCSNPENLNCQIEKYVRNGAEGIYGKEYTSDEIFDEIMKDKAFYEDGGGVTFSGGEALLHAKELYPLLIKLKDSGITTAVETSLFIPSANLELVLPFIDFFYVDMKIVNSQRCKNVLGGDIYLYRKNLDFLTSQKQVVIRIPVIGGFTDDEPNTNEIIEELKEYKKGILKVEIIKGHNLGESKYKALGKTVPQYIKVDDSFMEKYKERIETEVGVPVEICKI